MYGYNSRRKPSFFSAHLEAILVGGAIFLILLSLVFTIGGKYVYAGRVRANAERYALSYAREIEGMASPRAQCMSMDTDNNGYVTCSIRDDAATSSRPTQIECVANMLVEFNTGCRGYRVRTLEVNTDQQ